MLLDTIIFLLRESIEAGALLSLLLCISNQNKVDLHWLWSGLLLGVLVAIMYALNFSDIGEWFEYTGQEVVNASLLLSIYLCLLLLCIMLIFTQTSFKLLYPLLLGAIIACVITRELTEVVIFYIGFFQSNADLVTGITSGFIGLMIGASFGVLYYYAINIWSRLVSRNIQIVLLTFIAAGMSVQALQLLMQVDLISSTKPLWDTNWLLAESSISGQMTYAIFGYEATPSASEVGLYMATIVFIFTLLFIKYVQQNQLSFKTHDS